MERYLKQEGTRPTWPNRHNQSVGIAMATAAWRSCHNLSGCTSEGLVLWGLGGSVCSARPHRGLKSSGLVSVEPPQDVWRQPPQPTALKGASFWRRGRGDGEGHPDWSLLGVLPPGGRPQFYTSVHIHVQHLGPSDLQDVLKVRLLL